MKCKWSWIHYLWPPFATITLKSEDPVVHGAVVLNSSPGRKRPSRPSHLKSTLINARLCHGMQHFTASGVHRETRVDGRQHDEAICVAELCPGDKRTQGFMDDILTFDNINTLLLMDYGVLLHTHSARCLKMKCYPLINWVEPPDAIIWRRAVLQQKGNVNIYLPIRAGGAVWTSNLITQDDFIRLIPWWRIWSSCSKQSCNTLTLLCHA